MIRKENEIIQPYFSHDYNPRSDKKIIKLFMEMGAEGYGLYWLIVEHMHQNHFMLNDESVIAYDLRTEVEKIHRIMTGFELFRIEGDEYISDRILRNLNYVEQKSEDKKNAANTRWLLSAFNKHYEEFFGEKPILEPEEIETLKKYSAQIPDLKDKLRDVLYTLKGINFSNDINFKPCANWLLKSNNLARLLNGEFGKLRHKKTNKELKDEEREKEMQLEEKSKPSDIELQIATISGKCEALEYICGFPQPVELRGKLCILPALRKLMKKFDITDTEVKNYYAKENNE